MNIFTFVALFFLVFPIYFTFEDSCEDIHCSNVYDPVCGEGTSLNGKRFVKRFHNICYMKMIQCNFKTAGNFTTNFLLRIM